jgi:hypothetical protein
MRRNFFHRIGDAVLAFVQRDGVKEGEGVVGEARAPGRRSGRLERQLARARKGIRRLGRARFEGVGDDKTSADLNRPPPIEEDGKGAENREEGGTAAATGTAAGLEKAPAPGSDAANGMDPPSQGYGAASGVDGVDAVDGVDGVDGVDPPSQSFRRRQEAVAGQDGAASPALPDSDAARAAGEAWNGRSARMEVEQWVAEAMAERERAEQQRDKTPELEGRLAAVETRLQTLEERARVSREL